MKRGRFAHLPEGSREMIALLGELLLATLTAERWPQASAYAHLIGETIAGWRDVCVARGDCEWSNDADVALQTWAHHGWELIEQCPSAVATDSEETDRIIEGAVDFALECSRAMTKRARRAMQRRDDEHDAWDREMSFPYYFHRT